MTEVLCYVIHIANRCVIALLRGIVCAVLVIKIGEKSLDHSINIGILSHGLHSALTSVHGVPDRALVKTSVAGFCNAAVLKLHHFNTENGRLASNAQISLVL